MTTDKKKRNLLQRLSDRRTAPRKWWFPIYPELDLPEEKRLAEVHEETSRTLRRALFALIGFSFFCGFVLLGTADRELIAEGSTIHVPIPLVAQYEMPFVGFLFVGPLVLIAITAYLHSFVQHWRALGERVPAVERVPFLFNLPHRSSRFLSALLCYWLTPLTLALFTWKSLPLPSFVWLAWTLALVTGWSLWLQIRRAPEANRRGNWIRWILLVALAVGLANLPALRDLRPLALFKADLSGQDLRSRNLAGADLSEAILTAANLTGANLSNANLGAADLTRANLSKANLIAAYLSGAVLKDTVLSGADLSMAWMEGLDLREAVLIAPGPMAATAELRGANLQGAKLNQADLVGADLRQADLTDADLTGAVLAGAVLVDATLSSANLSGADLSEADLSLALLTGADLARSRLSNAKLVGTSLRGAKLTGADLTGADLSQAKQADSGWTDAEVATIEKEIEGIGVESLFPQPASLADADLGEALLVGANLAGADLTGANLSRADLSDVANLTQEQLDASCVEDGRPALLPEGFQQPSWCQGP